MTDKPLINELWKQFLMQIPLSFMNKRMQAAGIKLDGFRPGNIPEKLKRNAIMSIVSSEKELESFKAEMQKNWSKDPRNAELHLDTLTDGEIMVLCVDEDRRFHILVSLLLEPAGREELIQAILDKQAALQVPQPETPAAEKDLADELAALLQEKETLKAETQRLKKDLKKSADSESQLRKKLSDAEGRYRRLENTLLNEQRRAGQQATQIAQLKESLEAAAKETKELLQQHKRELAERDRQLELQGKEQIVIIGEMNEAIAALLAEQSKYHVVFIDAANHETSYDKERLEQKRKIYVIKYTMHQSQLRQIEEQELTYIELADFNNLKKIFR